MTIPFLPARAKLWIGSIDDPKIEVRAQYNPKELQLDKQVPWGEHKAKLDKSGSKKTKPEDRSQQGDLELTGAPKRTMTIELLFDSAELPKVSIEPDVQALEELSSVWKPESAKPEERRPHHCIVVWGASGSGMRPFRCVIESLSTKYTMWDHSGVPKRATCTVKLKEAYELTPSVGLQGTDLAVKEAKYGEKRRPPMWDRKKPAEYDAKTEDGKDNLSAQDYDAEVEKFLRTPPGEDPQPGSAPAPASGPAPAPAPPGPPGRAR